MSAGGLLANRSDEGWGLYILVLLGIDVYTSITETPLAYLGLNLYLPFCNTVWILSLGCSILNVKSMVFEY